MSERGRGGEVKEEEKLRVPELKPDVAVYFTPDGRVVEKSREYELVAKPGIDLDVEVVWKPGERVDEDEVEVVWKPGERVDEDEVEVVAKPGLPPFDEEVVWKPGEWVDGDEVDIVYKPGVDPALAYMHGLTNEIPRVSEEEVRMYAYEAKRYANMVKIGREMRALWLKEKISKWKMYSRRAAKIVYYNCPYRRVGACPLLNVAAKCPLDLEKRCRAIALAKIKRKRKV